MKKKLFSLAVTLVMALSLAVPAMAAGEGDTGSITVDNPVSGQTYTAHKIFDVTYADVVGDSDPTKFAYSIDKEDEWFETVSTYAQQAGSGLTLTPSAKDADKLIVEVTADFSAAEFAKTLATAVEGKTGGVTLVIADGKATADNLPLGYYFVKSTTGALCNLTTTNPDVTIHDKNDVPFEKTDDAADVEVGQTVNYTITGKVPDTTGFESYTYTITDTMSEGLTFSGTVTVMVGGAQLAVEHYRFVPSDNSFTLSIDVMEIQDKVGQEIKVTYSAVVNENAIAVISTNEAKLEYSNDPTTDTTTETGKEEEKVFTSKITIDKYQEGETTTKLPDAKFVLYKVVDGQTLYYQYTEPSAGVIARVSWVENIADATEVTTDDNGAAEFKGLKNGVYYLLETEAPEGYNLLDKAVEVKVEGSDTSANLNVTSSVANGTGAILPGTGGMGTTIFYVVGGTLVVAAAVLLITKKRMHNVED